MDHLFSFSNSVHNGQGNRRQASTVHYLSPKPCERQTKSTLTELEQRWGIQRPCGTIRSSLQMVDIHTMDRRANIPSHTKNTGTVLKIFHETGDFPQTALTVKMVYGPGGNSPLPSKPIP